MSEINKTREQKIKAEIQRIEDAMKKTSSAYLKRDYQKHLKRLKKALATTLVLLAAFTGSVVAEQMWVFCNPESYVCIRESPNKKAHIGGYLYMGDEVETDGVIRGEWLHLPHTTTESGEGWVYRGYLDYSEPQRVDYSAKVKKRQTIVRGCIDGDVKKRLKKGTVVRVIAENLKWCITSVGYIKTDLLQEIR